MLYREPHHEAPRLKAAKKSRVTRNGSANVLQVNLITDDQRDDVSRAHTSRLQGAF